MLTLFPLFLVLYDFFTSMIIKQLDRISQIAPLYGFIMSLNTQMSFVWLQRWSSGVLSLSLYTGLNYLTSYVASHPFPHVFEVLFFKFDYAYGLVRVSMVLTGRDARPHQMDHGPVP